MYKCLIQKDDLTQMKDVWKFVNVKTLESSMGAHMKSKVHPMLHHVGVHHNLLSIQWDSCVVAHMNLMYTQRN